MYVIMVDGWIQERLIDRKPSVLRPYCFRVSDFANKKKVKSWNENISVVTVVIPVCVRKVIRFCYRRRKNSKIRCVKQK